MYGRATLPKHVIFMRHGESVANERGLFQGAGSTPLSDPGRRQAEQAGRRLTGSRFAVVESSDLERAVDTARIVGYEPRQRTAWREGDIGEWEGLEADVVIERYGDNLGRLQYDYDLRMGGTGESPRQMAERGAASLRDLVNRLDDGQSALVVTHGGLIGTVLWGLMGLPAGRRRLGMLANTSFCELTFGEAGPAVQRYNDAAHLGPISAWSERERREGAVVIDLIRHGVTFANLERRVQGQKDGSLHPKGREQARRLSNWIGQVDELYSSSLGRAMDTARIAFGRLAIPVDDLMEISMGEWEGEMWDELEAAGRLGGYPGEGNDIRRGHTGETWGDVQHRVAALLGKLYTTHAGQRVAAASHGGAIRAYTGSVLGLGFDKARLLGPIKNTAVSQVVIPPDGTPILGTYNVAGHLEG